MKKIMIFVVTALLLVSPFVAASTMTSSEETYPKSDMPKTTSDFTHTVFIEEGTTTWCPNCPNAAEALYSLYNTSEFPFYFVALVLDQNQRAQNRFWGHYRGMSIPTIFIDGGFNQTIGSGSTPQQTEQRYRPFIEGAGARIVHPLELTSNVTGHGDATLDITVTVKNTGSTPYFGYVRSYVTEKVSRWINNNGNPYHFGFLDYAIKKVVFLQPEKSQTFTMTWDGAAQHGNLTFPDIADDNIMVITTVVHWQPHLIAKVESIGTHFAFYVDQTTGATVQ
jgi:thiol-disulfide isomerase/thioredoxin